MRGLWWHQFEAELDEPPPLTTRQQQWESKPKTRRGRGRGRGGRGRGCRTVAAVGPETVLDSDEEAEIPSDREASVPKVPKAKTKAKTKAKPKPRAKAKTAASPKAKSKTRHVKKVAKGGSGGSKVESNDESKDPESKEDCKKEIPIVWGPILKSQVSHLFDSVFGPAFCRHHPQDQGDHVDQEPLSAVENGPCEVPGAAAPAGSEAGQPVSEAELPPKKLRRRNPVSASFARRPCPKTTPCKERWMAIREIYEKEIFQHVSYQGLPWVEFQVLGVLHAHLG